jgi:hypothetical protein
MCAPRVQRALPGLFILAILCPFLLAGCGDDSRTTGTQVQISEEAKAQIKDMRNMYKENKGMRKAARKGTD